MKTLYLDGPVNTYVQLEGPALKVKSESVATKRFPLSRISRVVVRADLVIWSTAAILACMRSGISITFLDRSGDPEGFCYGSRHLENSFGNNLREFLEFDNWREYYEIWVEAEERRFILDTLRKMGMAMPEDLRASAVHSTIRNEMVRSLNKDVIREAYQIQEGLLKTWVPSALLSRGVPADLFSWKRRGFNMSEDIARILQWSLHPIIRKFLRDLRIEGRTPERIDFIKAFESAGQELDFALNRVIDHLDARVREMVGI